MKSEDRLFIMLLNPAGVQLLLFISTPQYLRYRQPLGTLLTLNWLQEINFEKKRYNLLYQESMLALAPSIATAISLKLTLLTINKANNICAKQSIRDLCQFNLSFKIPLADSLHLFCRSWVYKIHCKSASYFFSFFPIFVFCPAQRKNPERFHKSSKSNHFS